MNAVVSGQHDNTIHAAGCLVYRDGPDGIEVLIAHRPHHDDWDLPKGKRDPGEDDLTCALREVEEETGYTGEVGAELATEYRMVGDRPKVVRWWLLRQTGGAFEVNDEVDEVRWVPVADAERILSYDFPRGLLASLPAPR